MSNILIMSRIGKLPIKVHKNVKVDINNNIINIKGPLGEFKQQIYSMVYVECNGDMLFVKRRADSKKCKAMHGLYRSLINNMIIGVNTGFIKKLELVGIGYRAYVYGQILELILGFSHTIVIVMPIEIKIELKTEKGKNTMILLKSYDKQLLGLIAAKIRSFRKPDPFKGKGVRYLGEDIRLKKGKSA